MECFCRHILTPYLGLLGGKVIGLPPVLNFGSPELKAKVVPEVLQAKKFIALAISEAHAGSDVAGITTTAVKSEDGKEWIINGEKKWITNGQYVVSPTLFALVLDFDLTASRTST